MAFRLTWERVSDDDDRVTWSVNRTLAPRIPIRRQLPWWKPDVDGFPTTAADASTGQQYVLHEEKGWHWARWHVTRVRIPPISPERRAQWTSQSHLFRSRFGTD